MVYEANARLRDPVYGSAGAICQLQKQVSELQAQLAKARAEVANMQQQQANLLALICMEMRQSPEPVWPPQLVDTTCFLDDATLSSPWEPLWTWSCRRTGILLQWYLIWVRERIKLIVILKYTLNIYINGNVDYDNNVNDFNWNMEGDPRFFPIYNCNILSFNGERKERNYERVLDFWRMVVVFI